MDGMKPFYRDEDAVKRQEEYVDKTMGEIMELENKDFDKRRLEIDAAHEKYADSRSKMLTVQKLIDYLKTQDPNACILAYEPNSDAYIEQLPELPSPDVENVVEAKKRLESNLRSWYKDSKNAEEKIKRDLEIVFRYAKDNDVIIRFC